MLPTCRRKCAEHLENAVRKAELWAGLQERGAELAALVRRLRVPGRASAACGGGGLAGAGRVGRGGGVRRQDLEGARSLSTGFVRSEDARLWSS